MTVGDATTGRLVSLGLIPDVAVVDGKEKRITRPFPAYDVTTELRCSNMQGSIMDDSVAVLRQALSAPKPVRVLVEGEEDLLTLPLICMAPHGSVILYGQPNEGIVIVTIGEEIVKKSKDLMDRIRMK